MLAWGGGLSWGPLVPLPPCDGGGCVVGLVLAPCAPWASLKEPEAARLLRPESLESKPGLAMLSSFSSRQHADDTDGRA